jgi:hypothetical protein
MDGPPWKCNACGEMTLAIAAGYICPDCGRVYQPYTPERVQNVSSAIPAPQVQP